MIALFKFTKFLYIRIGYRLFIWIVLLSFGILLEGISFVLFMPLLESVFNNDFFQIPHVFTHLSYGINFILQQLTIQSLVIVIAAFFILRTILLIAQSIYVGNIIKRLNIQIMESISIGIFQCSYGFFISQPARIFNNAIITESKGVVIACRVYARLISSFLLFIIYINIALLINASITLIAMALIATLYVALYYFIRKIRQISELSVENNSMLQNTVLEYLNNFKYFKYCNLELLIKSHLSHFINKHAKFGFMHSVYEFILSNITQCAIIMLICLMLFMKSNSLSTDLLEVLVLIVVIKRALDWMNNSFNSYIEFQQYYGSIEIYYKLYNNIQEDIHNNNQYSNINPTFQNNITLDRITFQYTDDKIIDNFSFIIPHNQIIAISGISGSGKTTLLNLISGILTPQEGVILYDNISYKDLDLNKLRNSIGYLTQDPIIFNDSIYNNITLWETSNKLDEEYDVILIDKIENMISSVSLRMNSVLEISGSNISGGQKQVVQFARELYKNPKILILDEIANNIDMNTMNVVVDIIKYLKHSKTIIIVDHSLVFEELIDTKYEIQNGSLLKNDVS